jgi:hypothetical protein
VPTALQLRELRLIDEAGGISMIIREDTIALLELLMTDIDDRSKKDNL